MAGERIRILIVDDHLAVAEGFHAPLSRQPDFELTDVATNGRAALWEKLDAHSRLEAVVRANELGLLTT